MAKLDARNSGTFKIGGDIEIYRLGFGTMRITGKGIWGPPEDRTEALRTLKRDGARHRFRRYRRLLRTRRIGTADPRGALSL